MKRKNQEHISSQKPIKNNPKIPNVTGIEKFEERGRRKGNSLIGKHKAQKIETKKRPRPINFTLIYPLFFFSI